MEDKRVTCIHCGGNGVEPSTKAELADGMFFDCNPRCTVCGGSGKVTPERIAVLALMRNAQESAKASVSSGSETSME